MAAGWRWWRSVWVVLALAAAGLAMAAGPVPDAATAAAFEPIAARAAAAKAASWPALLQQIATDPALLGAPYEAAPLDRGSREADEPLRASLDGFDCVTYVETVLALARTVARGPATATAYAAELAALRYRDGEPGFCARYHYFSDWAETRQSAAVLDEVTVSVAGDPANLANLGLTHGFDYLSRHASATPALAQSPARLACVREQERALSARDDGTPYIRSTSLPKIARALQSGDLIAWVADVPGLDVIHVGIVVTRPNGRLELAQASKRAGQVVVTPDLLRYAASLKQQRGVRIFRPRDPR